MYIEGLYFNCTCNACPEQYEVLNNHNKVVGYVRLRWGGLSCEYPYVGGETIYRASIGDGFTGCFESEEQREEHLRNIANKILEKINA